MCRAHLSENVGSASGLEGRRLAVRWWAGFGLMGDTAGVHTDDAFRVSIAAVSATERSRVIETVARGV